MNIYFLIAGIISLMAVAGHFTMGSKIYLKPVISSEIDEIPRRVMQGLFHYMSVLMILTSIILLTSAFEINLLAENIDSAILFIGVVYGGFALVQIRIAFVSNVEKGISKMFQWVFWIAISILSIVGVM